MGSDWADGRVAPHPVCHSLPQSRHGGIWKHSGLTWTSIFFIVTGFLAIVGARKGSKSLVVATMVMAILSAVCAGILTITSSILLAADADWRCRHYGDSGCTAMVTSSI